MKRQYFLLFFLIYITIFSCSSTRPPLENPIEDRCILIGSLIFDINGYQDNFTTIYENIEIVIIGNVVEDGRVKTKGYVTETGENGVFYLANVPKGEYAIKGFRVHLIGTGDLIVSNELIDPRRNYFELNVREIIPFTGSLFDTKVNHRVINFEHNIFTLYPDKMIRFDRYEDLKEFKMSSGDELSMPLLPHYFLDNFEGNPWTKYFELQTNY